MKVLLTVVTAIASLVAAAWVVGTVIPPEHVASRSARYAVPPDSIWSVLDDLPGYADWAPEVTGVRRLPDLNGRPVYALEGKWGMPLAIEAAEPGRLLVTRIADPRLPFAGTWTWEITRDAQGSIVTVTERGQIRMPLMRALARFVFGYESTMDSYLRALGRAVADDVTPGPADR